MNDYSVNKRIACNYALIVNETIEQFLRESAEQQWSINDLAFAYTLALIRKLVEVADVSDDSARLISIEVTRGIQDAVHHYLNRNVEVEGRLSHGLNS